MKKYISLLFLFWAVVTLVSAQNITRLEYSIDGFVAEGKGTTVEIPGNSNELNTNFNIDISSLEPGNHTIYFRAMNEEGVWSFAAERSFYIPEPPIEDGIVAMEYSIDKYVKEGDGEYLSLEMSTNMLDSLLKIDISDLDAGIHNIYFRSKNKMGVWSLPVSKSFVVVKPDTTKVENIMYRFYNDSYQGIWMTAKVDPARKNVDTVFMASTAGLDLAQNYTIEFYAKNNMQVRSFSAFLNNVDLQMNNAPMRMKDTLKLLVSSNQHMDVQMDSLFSDADLVVGDSLMYSLEGMDAVDVQNFTDWSLNDILSFMPAAENSGMYNFWIKTTDMAGESDSVYVDLTVRDATGIDSWNEQNAFVVYPNPANELLTIKNNTGNFSDYSLKLYTSDGRLLLMRNVSETVFKLPLNDYPQGIYVIYLVNNDFTVKKKIIKR